MNLYDQCNSPYSIRRILRFNDPAKPKYGQQLTAADGDTVWHFAPYTTKWNNFNPADVNGYSTFKDQPMMRLGETYLLMAEAKFTHAEENRRMTLVRTGTLVERVQNYLNAYNTGAGQPVTGLSNVATRKGLLPVPQSAIDLNKGAVLTQNTGY